MKKPKLRWATVKDEESLELLVREYKAQKWTEFELYIDASRAVFNYEYRQKVREIAVYTFKAERWYDSFLRETS